MQQRIRSLFLFYALFLVLPANEMLACGNNGTTKCGQQQEQSCCSGKDDPDTAACPEKPSGHKCPEDKDSGACHCPCGAGSCSPSGGWLTVCQPVLPAFSLLNQGALRQAFYYAKHVPEEVYLPIWQPPQLLA